MQLIRQRTATNIQTRSIAPVWFDVFTNWVNTDNKHVLWNQQYRTGYEMKTIEKKKKINSQLLISAQEYNTYSSPSQHPTPINEWIFWCGCSNTLHTHIFLGTFEHCHKPHGESLCYPPTRNVLNIRYFDQSRIAYNFK